MKEDLYEVSNLLLDLGVSGTSISKIMDILNEEVGTESGQNTVVGPYNHSADDLSTAIGLRDNRIATFMLGLLAAAKKASEKGRGLPKEAHETKFSFVIQEVEKYINSQPDAMRLLLAVTLKAIEPE